jgi:hypothetical protein
MWKRGATFSCIAEQTPSEFPPQNHTNFKTTHKESGRLLKSAEILCYTDYRPSFNSEGFSEISPCLTHSLSLQISKTKN